MKKVVIAGSTKLQDKLDEWKEHFIQKGYEILDYPEAIESKDFLKKYPIIHKRFFDNIAKADILFIMNEDKNEIEGYIGAESFSELNYGLSQNLIFHKNIELVILKMPSAQVQSYEEIQLWLNLGWIKLYHEEDF